MQFFPVFFLLKKLKKKKNEAEFQLQYKRRIINLQTDKSFVKIIDHNDISPVMAHYTHNNFSILTS